MALDVPRAVVLSCAGASAEGACRDARSAGYVVVARLSCDTSRAGAAVLAELMQVASDLQADAAVVAEAAADTPLSITRCSRVAAEPPAQVSAAARVPPQTWRPGA